MTTQAHDSSAALVKMANDIADYFHSEPDRKLAVDGIVNHITRFWEPRMRKKILAHFAGHSGEGLNELARAAIARLAEAAKTSA
ncbi:formate dehydrogenase subunit delta [Rudaea cellulosilytica]|uniref:formate dehydrogenase subunit delta n=1 Tax=Rudaea cellulosilytica TaxID=540746 RepID=UPI000360CD3F|nr:formate dehydrogenase subunit delta [Rudaea cellulosilytica]